MTLLTNDAKVKHLDEYNELQLKHLRARVGVWEALHMAAMMLALALIGLLTAAFVLAVVALLTRML